MAKKLFFKLIYSHLYHFPATLGAIWLFTLILTFSLYHSLEEEIGLVLLFLFFYGSGSFLIESIFLRKARSKYFYALIVCNLIPSSLFVFLSKTIEYEYFNDYFFSYCACYFLIPFCLSIYFCHRKLACSFEEYLIRVFSKTLRYCITWFVLLIGISIITGMAGGLFHLDYTIMISAQLLLFGIYFMSSFLLSFYPEQPEDSLLINVLVKYIFTAIVITAYLIIYAYMLKILILWEIPVNAIFRITALLFVVTIPTCIMNKYYQENRLLSRITRWLPALFLPFFPLQVYSIGVRIYENGVTPMRYAAVALLIFECLTLFLYYFKPSHLHLLLITAVIFIFIAGVMPIVNMNYISFLNQKQIVARYLSLPEKERLTIVSARKNPNPSASHQEKVADRVYGAYCYLQYDYYGCPWLDQLSTADRNCLEALNLSPFDDYTDSIINFHGGISPSAVIDVSEYQYCYPVKVSIRAPIDEGNGENSQIPLSAYPLLSAQQPELTIDLIKLFDFYRKHADESHSIQSCLKEHRTYEVDATHTLWLQELSFNYDQNGDCYTYFLISGYLLEKE